MGISEVVCDEIYILNNETPANLAKLSSTRIQNVSQYKITKTVNFKT